MGSRAQSILDEIRRRHNPGSYGPLPDTPESQEPEIATQRMTADDWQEFKRKFVVEYGDEPVQPTGMTHSEFMHYIKTSGDRENDEFNGRRRLQQILREMDRDDLA